MTEQRIAEIKEQARKEVPYVVKERTDFGIKSLYIQGSGNRKTFVYSTGSLIDEGFRPALINDMCRQLNAVHQAALTQERLKSEDLIEAAEEVVKRWESPQWKWDEHTGVFVNRLRDALSKYKQQTPTEG